MPVAPSPLRRQLSDAEVQGLVAAGKTPKSIELERLQAYFEGTQYKGRPAYLDMASETPRLERAPCVVYPLVKAACESNVALAMGGQRFPRVLSMSSENDASFDADFGLSQADSEALDQFNAKLVDLAGLQSAFSQAYRVAQIARSAVLLFSYRNGLPSVDVVWPKLCSGTYDPKTGALTAIEIRYRYVEYWRDALQTGGAWWPVVKEYRRVIDGTADTVFVPKEIWSLDDIAPTAAQQSRTVHGFGLVPALWYYRHRDGQSQDGISIHDGKLGELDAINHALSSRHLGAMYCGDPMMVATGVDPDEGLGASGRAARIDRIDGSVPTQWDKALFGGAGGTSRIRKGPGELWRSANPDAAISYLTLPSDGLDAIDKHAQDLCSKVREALRYVWIDPAQLTGAGDISGKTLAFVFSSQLHAVSQDRGDFGRNCLLPALGIIYQMLIAQSDGVYLPGLKKALPVLARFIVQGQFIAPQLYLKWGDFFEASDTDEATRVSAAIQALGANIVTKPTAVEHVRDIFAIGNVDQYVDALEQEALDKQAKALANAQAMAAIAGPPQAAPAAGDAAPIPGAAKPAAPPLPKRGAKKAKAK